VESKLGPLGTSATEWPIVPDPDDYDDGEFGGMKFGRGNRSTRRKRSPASLCPPKIPLDQTQARTRTAAVGSQRLTAWAMARPLVVVYLKGIGFVPSPGLFSTLSKLHTPIDTSVVPVKHTVNARNKYIHKGTLVTWAIKHTSEK
jgi:hypothetical protein